MLIILKSDVLFLTISVQEEFYQGKRKLCIGVRSFFVDFRFGRIVNDKGVRVE